jgi:hypothetical protein
MLSKFLVPSVGKELIMEFKFSVNLADKKCDCVCNSTDHEAELWNESFEKMADMVEWFQDNTTKRRETADAIASAIITFCDTYSQKNKTYTEDVKRRYERQWRSEEKRAAAEAEAEEARRDKTLR